MLPEDRRDLEDFVVRMTPAKKTQKIERQLAICEKGIIAVCVVLALNNIVIPLLIFMGY